MRTCLKFIVFALTAITGFGYFCGAGAHVEQPTIQPKAPSDAFRWDGIKGKQQEPTWHRFAGEFPAGMLSRPGELTLDNWFHDGHLRTYALLRHNDVVRSVEVHRGAGPVFMFGNARRPRLLDEVTLRFQEPDFPQPDKALSARELFDWINAQGILVVRNGKIVFEDYPGMDPGLRHMWMSISKSILNMLLGLLVSEGKLDMTKNVEHYIADLRKKDYGSFTLQELADMNADVDMNESNYQDPKSPFWDFGRSMNWFNDDGRWPGGNKQFLTTVKRLEKATGEKAAKVRYTSSNSQVLAWVIENVSGRPFSEVVEDKLWKRIGAVANASYSVDKTDFPFAGGGFSTTLRDLARYGTIWANKGLAPDGNRIFEDAWIKENTSGKGPAIGKYNYHNQSYSNGTAIVHQGHSGQILWVNPQSGTIVACFGSVTTPGGGNRWSRQAHVALAEAIDQYLRDNKIAASP